MVEKKELNKVLLLNSMAETGELEENIEVASFLLEKSQQLGDQIYLIVYKHHEVLIGSIENRTLNLTRPEELTPEYLKELRMFSKDGELYLWNQGGKFKYRLRLDNQGEQSDIYDEEHFMWGTNLLDEDEYTVVEPNRGMRLSFPFFINDKKLPLKYHVRNYLDYDENGQIQFYDARLVNFLDSKGKEL